MLVAHPAGIDVLLGALENRRVLATEIDAAHRQQLLDRTSGIFQERVKTVFSVSPTTSRDAVLAHFRPTLAMTGKADRGRENFRKLCANCHKLGDLGQDAGPDLSALRNKSAAYLLTNVLDPNRAVEARYLGYSVLLNDGRTLTGVIVSETATSITLAAADGRRDVVHTSAAGGNGRARARSHGCDQHRLPAVHAADLEPFSSPSACPL